MREFSYASPADVPAVLSRRAATTAGRYLGGGTTLFDLMKLGVESPTAVIDITRCDDLRAMNVGRSEWRLGAAMTMADVADHAAVRREFPALAESLWKAASQQIRNMATLGGNLLQRTRCAYFRGTPAYPCNKRQPGSGCSAREGLNRGHAVLGGSEHCVATYAGDLAVALVAFDAVVDLCSPRGQRSLPVLDLHREPASAPHLETTLADDELIVAIRVPYVPAARASVYHKVRDRESYAFALASAAVGLEMAGGRVVDVRIGLGGVATRPWRAGAAEQQLLGQPLTRESARQAAESAFADARPLHHNRFKVGLGIDVLTDALMQSKARL